ncbi:hypothetical protein ACIBL3_46910 [Kribbella sp. NPDC050124]|uniref:hypothetical protein n=1 Tax=Kribbella sp. NPDC050124 TaxID=3364114 RepID=UPI003790DC32
MNYLAPTDNQSLLLFLSKWYGDRPSAGVQVGHESGAPTELVEWHEISARWGGAITAHNYAVPLAELRIEDGKIPFWVENQGTWEWAFDPNDEAHSVYEREPSEGGNPWTPTGERLSDFLIHATVLEAILGAPATKVAQGVPAGLLGSQTGGRELPFLPWNWPARDSRIILGEKWLALVHPSDDIESGHDIVLAAVAPEDLAWAETTPGIKWRSYTNPQDHTTDEPPPW